MTTNQTQINKEISIRDAVAERVRQEEASEKQEQVSLFSTKTIMRALSRNEKGDAELFQKLNQDKFVFFRNTQEWLRWNGVYWERDYSGFTYQGVKEIAQLYENEAVSFANHIQHPPEGVEVESAKQALKLLNERAKQLRSLKRIGNALQMATYLGKNSMVISADETDNLPYLLPCKNGVLNLKTGELETGKPKNYMAMASPVEWQGIEAPCLLWDKTLSEIFGGNQQIIDCFQRVVGMATIGLAANYLVIFFGSGRNGKRVITEVL